jgi:16S rRNA (guanine(966)-N(2))-methyltransferase RsmD
MVRIITGSAKGKQLTIPNKSRPINDRAKSSIFSVIGTDIVDKRILDLYAGSGSLGIESLSRGAKHCTFVESSRYAAKDLKENLEKTQLSGKGHVTQQKVLPFLGNQPPDQYDIVFADPPFNYYKEKTSRAESLLEQILPVIPDGGAIILKYPKTLARPKIDSLIEADHRVFGSNAITLWVKKSKN